MATGSPSAMRTRNSPPSHSPSETSRSSGTTTGASPVRCASGAAVRWVRRSVVTNRPARPSPASRSADRVRLRLALRCERRVAVAVDERERLALDRRRGRTVADEDHLGRARRELEGALVVAVRHGGGVSQETAQR